MIGGTLNHYRILKLLGQGGMGDVYIAQDTDLRRPLRGECRSDKLRVSSNYSRLRDAGAASCPCHRRGCVLFPGCQGRLVRPCVD